MQRVSIANSESEKLSGILENAPSKQLVILCHGRLCTKGQYFFPELAKALAKAGFSVYRFDFAGNGKSEGRFEESTVTKGIDDLKSVADYFTAGNYEIRCIIGHSQGAVEALLFQARYGSAKSIIGISGVVNQEDMTRNKFSKNQLKELEKNVFFTLKDGAKKWKISGKYFYDRAWYGDIRQSIKSITCPV